MEKVWIVEGTRRGQGEKLRRQREGKGKVMKRRKKVRKEKD